MNKIDRSKIGSLSFGGAMDQLGALEASVHLGYVFREVLVAMRSSVDAVIKNKEQKAEVKLQKVTID